MAVVKKVDISAIDVQVRVIVYKLYTNIKEEENFKNFVRVVRILNAVGNALNEDKDENKTI